MVWRAMKARTPTPLSLATLVVGPARRDQLGHGGGGLRATAPEYRPCSWTRAALADLSERHASLTDTLLHIHVLVTNTLMHTYVNIPLPHDSTTPVDSSD
eukprot:8057331-Alexandrium_andersonii.AAC.1